MPAASAAGLPALGPSARRADESLVRPPGGKTIRTWLPGTEVPGKDRSPSGRIRCGPDSKPVSLTNPDHSPRSTQSPQRKAREEEIDVSKHSTKYTLSNQAACESAHNFLLNKSLRSPRLCGINDPSWNVHGQAGRSDPSTRAGARAGRRGRRWRVTGRGRAEEHTAEVQSH